MPKCGLCIISSAHHRRFFLMWFLALGHCHAQGLTSDTERTTSYSHTYTHTHTHTQTHTETHTHTHTHTAQDMQNRVHIWLKWRRVSLLNFKNQSFALTLAWCTVCVSMCLCGTPLQWESTHPHTHTHTHRNTPHTQTHTHIKFCWGVNFGCRHQGRAQEFWRAIALPWKKGATR